MKKIKIKTNIRVPFYDLDPMNIVWHGNYIKYMEEARCDFFKKINYTYEDMYKDGIIYPIAKLEIKYIKSAKMGDNLAVYTELKETSPAIIFSYEIINEDTGDKLLSAKTMQIGVDTKTNETVHELNKNFKKRLENYEE